MKAVTAIVALLIIAALAAIGGNVAPAAAQGGSVAADRAALEAFYRATKGDRWQFNTNWMTDAPIGQWYGVRTDGNGRVTVLHLASNRLDGTLPPELSSLSELTALRLWDNRLTGRIPLSLGRLSNLTELFLDDNQLTGPIPYELGLLSNLADLGLGGTNQLTGCVPDTLRNVPTSDLDSLGLPYCDPLPEGQLVPVKMYWTVEGKIQRANPDGSNIEVLVMGLRNPYGIALDVSAGKMYWTDYGTSKVQRANLDGSNVEDLVTGLDEPIGIALDASVGKMYWAGHGTGKIQRANLDGSNVEDLVTGLRNPVDIALDVSAGKMYWTNNGAYKIQRADLDGSNVEDLVTGLRNLYGITLDISAGKMYWTNRSPSKVQRADLDGSNVEDLVTGLYHPDGIVVSAGKIYWVDYNDRYIRRANLDGSRVEDVLTNLDAPADITVATPPIDQVTATDVPQLYWVDEEAQKIQRTIAADDAQVVDDLTTSEQRLKMPGSIALDPLAGKMYWTDDGTEGEPDGAIRRANLDGSGVENLFSGLADPVGIALDLEGNRLYWADRSLGAIYRANFADISDAGLITRYETLLPNLVKPYQIALDTANGHMYWTERGEGEGRSKIRRADLKAAKITAESISFSPGAPHNPFGLALDPVAGKMYWTERSTLSTGPDFILSADLDGSNVALVITSEYHSLSGIAVDVNDGKIYWTDEVAGTIRRADPNNPDPAKTVEDVVTGLEAPEGIAVARPYLSATRLALTALYRATDGDNWTNNDGWLGDAHIGEWRGIATDNNGRATVLNLRSNGLVGELPPQLGDLISLRGLHLQDNHLTGELPPELGQLANLSWLNLNGNRLTGGIPQGLANLTQLTRLHLADNLLGYPTGFEYASRYLPLELPSDLGNLTNLKVLNLASNDFGGEIPTELANLTDLGVLNLSYNQIDGEIPTALGNLVRLTELNLSHNELSGTIPYQLSSFANLAGCETIWGTALNEETLDILKPSTGSLANLKTLDLSDNKLSGTIPPTLCSLADLDTLDVGRNRLTGTIPPELGKLAKLRALRLNGQSPYNKYLFSGHEDEERLEKCKDECYLHGQIPLELGNITNLEILDLSDNKLSGLIPQNLGFWGFQDIEYYNLKTLDLSGNKLNGEMPVELGGLTKLISLDLSRNDLSGEIPPSLRRLTKLRKLDLYDNDLSGFIPAGLGELFYLETLNLRRNELTGSIPSELGGLSYLRMLNLSRNALNDEIPARLGDLSRLRTLNLSRNDLEYRTPTTLSTLVNLDMLDLSHNQYLTVDVSQLGHIRLVHLYLAGTLAVECLPKEWRTVPYNDLDQVELADCAEVPEIEQERKALIALYNATDGDNWAFKGQWTNIDQYPDGWPGVKVNGQGYVTELNLQYNNLVGEIPPALGDLTKLQTLRLERNSLSGCVPQVGNLIAALDDGRIEWQDELRNDLLGTDPNAPLWEFMLLGGGFVAAEFFGGEEGKSIATHALNPTFDTSPTFSVGLPPCAPWPEKLASTVPWSSQDAHSDRDALLSLCGLYSHEDRGNCPWKGWDHTTALSDWHGVKTVNGRVVHLELTNKGLEGMIPEQLGNLGALQYLNLSNNRLYGEIPSQLGNLTNLHSLALNNNKLTGSIPAELGHLGEGNERKEWFVDLHLQENHLTGQVPPELASIGYLRTIKIDPQRDESDQNVTYELKGCLPANIVLDTTSIMVNFLPNFFSKTVGSASKAVSKALKESAVEALLKTKKGQRNVHELGPEEATKVAVEQVNAAFEGAEVAKNHLAQIDESNVLEDIRGISGRIARGALSAVLTGLSFALDLVGSAFSELEKRWADISGTGDRDDVRCEAY